MMMIPSIFGESLLDEFTRSPFDQVFGRGFDNSGKGIMKTDIKEHDNKYELTMELPGYKKEDVSAQLEDGYLTISASRNTDNSQKDEKGNYIRQERYYGSCSRSFYIGENLKEEDIKARFENGVLHLEFPKVNQQAVEQKKYISIEG